MPDGGPDCCGTCWFNKKNKGQAGHAHARDPGQAFCTIRELLIPVPFWTYCANHPLNNPERITVPLGPVYTCLHDITPSYEREVWVEAPSDEETVNALLHHLESIPQWPRTPTGNPPAFDRILIRHLGHSREPRAVPGLRRILTFDPDVEVRTEEDYPLPAEHAREVACLNRRRVIASAIEALVRILGDDALDDIRDFVRYGLDRQGDPLETDGVIRRQVVQSLECCSAERAREMLETATQDPNPEIAELAKKLLAEKRTRG